LRELESPPGDYTARLVAAWPVMIALHAGVEGGWPELDAVQAGRRVASSVVQAKL
jgi:hypothetical protein